MILVLAGYGKTTIATQLAALFAADDQRVVLVDATQKRHASRWVGRRLSYPHAPRIDVQPIRGVIGQALLTLSRRYDRVIVDAADHGQELASALLQADRVLIPFTPSQFDLEGLRDLASDLAVAQDANPKLAACAFANQAETNWTRSHRARDAIAWLTESCPLMACAGQVVSYRPAAFQEAAETGLSIFERTSVSAQKAAEQLHELWREATSPAPSTTTTEENDDIRQAAG